MWYDAPSRCIISQYSHRELIMMSINLEYEKEIDFALLV